MLNFTEMGLNEKLLRALEELGFATPSPIQSAAIPRLIKSDRDLIALAQTGTGKTAAFSLPILQKIGHNKKELQAIILCPTRELCLQLHADIKRYSKYMNGVEAVAVYGGERIDIQIRGLRAGANIVVGTPGRVMDLIRRKILKLGDIRWLVLDEADEMLDMGFKDDLDAILSETPKTRQTLLFSATMSKSVRSIAEEYMKNPEEISMGEKNRGADKVSHEYYVVNAHDRFEALKRILDYIEGAYGILFCRTKIETQRVADMLKQAGYDAEPIHGDVTQAIRTKIMDNFKKKRIRLLVATDVAARGIDVSDLTHVINYNMPDQPETYTHRSGRTGRAQKSGISITIFTPKELSKLKPLERVIGKDFEYKKVPGAKEIFERRIDTFLERVMDCQIDEDTASFRLIEEKLKKAKKDDLVRFVIQDKFARFLSEAEGASDINSAQRAVSKDRERLTEESGLKINLGKNHGFDVKALFGLFNSDRDLKMVKIGRIQLYPEYSVFSVAPESVAIVSEILPEKKYRGKKIIIGAAPAREMSARPSYQKGKFAGKKKKFKR